MIMRIVPDVSRFVVLDFETTGLSPDYGAEVIEISAREVVGGIEKQELRTFVAAEDGVPHEITELTGISAEMLKGAPNWTVAMNHLFDFVGSDTVVAHNASFEQRFLKSYAGRLGRDSRISTLCTVLLSRRIFPNRSSYKLGEIASALNIRGTGTFHRASDDTHLTLLLFEKICSTLRDAYGRDDVHLEMLLKAQVREIDGFGSWITAFPRKSVAQPTPSVADYESGLLAQGMPLDVARAAQMFFTSGEGKTFSEEQIAQALLEIVAEFREPLAVPSQDVANRDEKTPVIELSDNAAEPGIAKLGSARTVKCSECNMLYMNVNAHLSPSSQGQKGPRKGRADGGERCRHGRVGSGWLAGHGWQAGQRIIAHLV